MVKTAGCVANSVDPDQRPHSVVYSLGQYCLLCSGPSVRICRVDTVVWKNFSVTFKIPVLLPHSEIGEVGHMFQGTMAIHYFSLISA